jgi:hypothetical protein
MEVDLTDLASRGISRSNRAFAAGITFAIPLLIVLLAVLQFSSTGFTPGNVDAIAFVSPFGIFNLVLGIYALRTSRAPGAVKLLVDSEGLYLYFANGRIDRYLWREKNMHFTMIFLRKSDKAGNPYTFLRSFWRPPSRIPRDLGEQLLGVFHSVGVNVVSGQQKLRFYGMATVYEVRGN